MPRYELVDGKSSKFWEIEVDGCDVTTRWGRIGTNGQTKTKRFDDGDDAEKARDKQVATKVKKGYHEVDGDDEAPAAKAAPAAKKKPANKAAPPPEPEDDGLAWVDSGSGYALALDQGKLVARNAKGKRLASVPKKARDTDIAEQLRSVGEWLQTHERECGQTVDTWMLRSLPVPRAVLETVWSDPAWRGPLENAIVSADEHEGSFRGVDPDKGVGVVDLDGESVWFDPAVINIPHPILIEELDDWRELATELSIEQQITQLFRETWTRNEKQTDEKTSVRDFSGGKFEMLMHAVGRCRTHGYRVKGGYATCPVWEDGRMVEARYWIGSDYPEYETETGELLWVNSKEQSLPLGEVGPTAFSEGMRMASAIYAGRVVKQDGEDD